MPVILDYNGKVFLESDIMPLSLVRKAWSKALNKEFKEKSYFAQFMRPLLVDHRGRELVPAKPGEHVVTIGG